MGAMLEVSFINSDVNFYDHSVRQMLPATPLAFLRSLTGLTVFDILGKDNSRSRVVTTLIHGNEPSGLIAAHLWLKSLEIPSVNIRIIICNPEAANTKPYFTNRYVEHSDDLNRFFAASDSDQSPVAQRARKIVELVNEVKPEAIVDLHNTSGASPAFSVSVSEEKSHKQLVKLFTKRLILSQLNVGAIMEHAFDAPVVTIECGGADDNSAHDIASKGLMRFINRSQLFNENTDDIIVSKHPMRVELVEDASVGFSKQRLATTDLTLRADIEMLNHRLTKPGEFIGWCDPIQSMQIEAIDDNKINQIHSLFEIKNDCLFARKQMQLFMVTTSVEIATKDCLFYVSL